MVTLGTIGHSESHAPTDWLDMSLSVSQKVVLVIDVVESVRLMSANEAGTVARWHHFVQKAQHETIPTYRGRLVKSLGDGLMVEFDDARDAVRAAQSLHTHLRDANEGVSPEQQMHLRAGINSCQIYTDQIDIYGAGVNLAARLTALAGPGETVVSAEVRDLLTDGLDAHVEDLGECYLKHVQQPVRVYRVGAQGMAPVLSSPSDYGSPLQPAIAVVPFVNRENSPEHFAVGALIADGVIARLSKTRELKVISRLSTGAFRERQTDSESIRQHLGADYVLVGSYVLHGNRLGISAELVETKSDRVLWADRRNAPLMDLFESESEVCEGLADQAHAVIMSSELRKAVTQPLPSLQSYSLLLGATSLMHRARPNEFDKARLMLERLTQLHRMNALPYAWMAKWYVLKTAQGWSANPKQDTTEALSCCDKALAVDSQSALALAITGQVHGYLRKDLNAAESFYYQALDCDPNESLAWLWLGMNAGFRGESDEAADSAERALLLSPLDPMRYYYQSLAASASIAAGRYDRAIELASASLRTNRTHSSTYRALAIAQVLSGDVAAGAASVSKLLRLEPHFTVSAFLTRYPGQQQAKAYSEMLADALARAGLPA